MPHDVSARTPLDTLPFASHPGVLTRLLDELGGAETVGAGAARLFLLDPALALLALETLAQTAPGLDLAALDFPACLARLDPAPLKARILAAATAQLGSPGPSAANLELAWRKALACAHFARALAEHSAYPGRDEAWLAGLLCWLPSFVRPGNHDESGVRTLAQTALDRLQLNSFLADALRHLDESTARLRDATPLVRLAVAAQRQTLNYPAFIPTLPHPDTQALMAPLTRTDLGRIQLAMAGALDALTADTGFPAPGELARALGHWQRLEAAAAEPALTAIASAARLAAHLAALDGLDQALYLHRMAETGTLVSTPLDDRPVPPIAIDPEGSTTAAAWALLTRDPVVVTLDMPPDAAVLDLQLIRRARAEGLAALPLGDASVTGVLIVHGPRPSLARVTAQTRLYRRLGELAGRRPAATIAPPMASQAPLADRVQQAARELSNPLGIIKNYLALVRAKLGEVRQEGGTQVAVELDIVDDELDRIVRIMRDLGSEAGTEPERARPPELPQELPPGPKLETRPGFPGGDFQI